MSSDQAGDELSALVGEVLDDTYRVLRPIGRGGMGRLYEGEHLLLRRRVAIKLLRADRRESARGRLLREARAMKSLSSEHVVRVFDLGLRDGDPFIVMELLSGIDLGQRVARDGPIPYPEAVDCLLEACVAVAEAHACGIIHRDIKPANLFLARSRGREMVKVLDFGISKLVEPDDVDELDATAENTMLGTPHYMPPEQLRNPTKIDERADIWALAVTLYHLLTGRLPFEGDTSREVTAAIFTDKPRPLSELLPEAPIELGRVIEQAMKKRPGERTGDVRRFAHGLAPFATDRGNRALALLPAAPASSPGQAIDLEPVPETITEAGVASTMSRDREEEPRAPRRRIVAILSLALAAGFMWLLQAERRPSERAMAHGGPPPVAIPAATNAASAPDPTPPSSSPKAEVPAVAPQPSPGRARPAVRNGAPPRPSATAPPSASAASSAAPVESGKSPTDIDGMPIVN